MKRVGLILMILMSLFSYGFAFDVVDSNDEDGVYFSFQNDFVKIRNDNNNSFVKLEYDIDGVEKNLSYNFFDCEDNKYCVNFFLKNIAQNEGHDFSKSLNFKITVLNEEKNIYLDLVEPSFNLTNISVDKTLKKINFKFTYNDDLKVKKVELYKKEGSDLVFISDVTQKNEFSYSLVKEDEHIFLFKVIDEAGNEFVKEVSQTVDDFFAPTIDELSLILNENLNYKMKFKISDNSNLKYYEIKQNNIKVSEDVTGKIISKEISIPFTSGNVEFKVIDDKNNQYSKVVSLNSPISNSYKSIFSQRKEFELNSNADSCYLIKVGSKTYNEGKNKFDKNKKEFSIEVSISSSEKTNIEFYCIKDNFKQYFKRDFVYDNNKPIIVPEITLEANDNGELVLEWDESYDKESQIKYILYRNSKEIYDGSKLKFVDKNVDYPDSYEYYVEVVDEAGNSVKSSKVEGAPKKVFVSFQSNLNDNMNVDFNDFIIKLNTDVNSDVKVVLMNNKQKIDEKFFENINKKDLDVKLNLTTGLNQIDIDIEDEFGNKYSNSFFVTYQEPTLVQEEVKPEEKIIESVKDVVLEQPTQQDNSTQEVIGESKFFNNYNWVWFLIILILFFIFIWFFIVNEDKLKGRSSSSNSRNTKKKDKVPIFHINRKKDAVLAKSFDDIKINRMKKQVEKQREVERAKKLVEKQEKHSELDKKKFEDMDKNKNKFDFEKHQKKNYVKEEVKEDMLESNKERRIREENENKSFFGIFKRKEKEEIKHDEMSVYLRREKDKKSWNSTKDYLLSEKLKKEQEFENKKKRAEEEKRKKEQEKLLGNEEERKKREEKERKEFEQKQKREGRHDRGKVDLDDYLKSKTKKRNKFYFAEKFVNRDLKRK